MRRKSTIQKKCWEVKGLLVNTEEATTEHAVRMGLLMGLQWALGVEFDSEGNTWSPIVVEETVMDEES